VNTWSKDFVSFHQPLSLAECIGELQFMNTITPFGSPNSPSIGYVAGNGRFEKHISKSSSEMNEASVNGIVTTAAPSVPDYRDELRELLDKAHNERGLTRYRLCKQMGIDSGTLSNVLAKRRHFSLDKLEQILALLGYRMMFAPLSETPNVGS
jgi:hypothetical protein